MRYSWPDASHSILGRLYNDSLKPLRRHLGLWGWIWIALQILIYGMYAFYQRFPTQEIRIVGANPAYEPYMRAIRTHEQWIWQRHARDNVARAWLRDEANLILYRKHSYARVLAGAIVSERQIPFNYVFVAEGTDALVPQFNIEEIRDVRTHYLSLLGDNEQRAELVIHEFRETGVAQLNELTTPDPWWMFNDTSFIPELEFLNDTQLTVTLLSGDTARFKDPLSWILPIGPEPRVPDQVEFERAVIARRIIPRPMPTFLLVAKKALPRVLLTSGALLLLYHLVKLSRAKRKTARTDGLAPAYRSAANACTCNHCGSVHPRQPSPTTSP